jgi:hypothetical protein
VLVRPQVHRILYARCLITFRLRCRGHERYGWAANLGVGQQSMTITPVIKNVAGLSATVAMIMGVSYCSEAPKYHFEHVTFEAGRQIPGARLIGATKSGDLASPVSWFWPATTTWNFAIPDPILTDRFFLVSFIYGRGDASVFLLDVDCEDREVDWYDLD